MITDHAAEPEPTMPICPFATWRPIPPQERIESEPEAMRHQQKTQFILHSAVGNYEGSIAWWKKKYDFQIYATFFVLRTGEIVQMVDSSFKANANADANRRAISAESEDGGHPDTVPWNDKQLDAWVKLIKWAQGAHPIPNVTCPSNAAPGIGFHTMFGNTPQLSPWLGEVPKTCPGIIRIHQFYSELLPALGYAAPADEEDTMFGRWTRRPATAPTSAPKKGGPPAKSTASKARASVGDWDDDDAFGQPDARATEARAFSRTRQA